MINEANIKSSMPLEFKRKVTAIFPITNAGIPFMPKTGKSSENVRLMVFSKDKFVV